MEGWCVLSSDGNVLRQEDGVEELDFQDEMLYGMREVDGVRLYWSLTKQQQLIKKIEQIQSEIKILEEEKVEETLQEHISILHRYNDAKDACESILGRLAEQNGVTTKSMYEKYSLDVDN